jgi:hypothetical protein
LQQIRPPMFEFASDAVLFPFQFQSPAFAPPRQRPPQFNTAVFGL